MLTNTHQPQEHLYEIIEEMNSRKESNQTTSKSTHKFENNCFNIKKL